MFSDQQLVLLHYRALASQLYRSRNFEESANTELFRLQEPIQRGATELQEAWQSLSFIGMKQTADILEAITETTLAVESGEYERVRGLVVAFEAMPSVMAVGAFRPEFDYYGKRLQDLGQPTQTGECVALHILIAEGRATVALTWLATNDIAHRFVQSFIAQPHERLSSLAIQTAYEHVEDVCASQNWWDRLPATSQRRLVNRVRDAGFLYKARRRSCLAYKHSYGDWVFQSSKFIHC